MLNPIDVYPITTKAQSQRDILLTELSGEPPHVRRTVKTSKETAHALADDPEDGELGSVLEERLIACAEYRNWRKQNPGVTHVPAIGRYRKGKRVAGDLAAITAEISVHGFFLPQGQVLFHGGNWMGTQAPHIGASVCLTDLLSATLSPQVAAAHARRHHPTGCLWMLEVATPNSVASFTFQRHGSSPFNHEFEVLIAPGPTVRCTGVTATNTLQVIECHLS